MNDSLDQIEGLREAEDQESLVRSASFLELGESICGIDVKPLTLRHLVLLEATGNKLICGGSVSVADVCAFFVVVSELEGWPRRVMMRRLGLMDAETVLREVAKFIDEAHQDAPGGQRQAGPSYYSGIAGLVDLIASEYGWAESDILGLPVKRAFQYVKAIIKRNHPGAIMFNPSDKVRGAWLRKVNGNTN